MTYSVQEVSDLTHIPYRTVARLVQTGELPSIVPNGCTRGYRVRRSTLAEWMSRREDESHA